MSNVLLQELGNSSPRVSVIVPLFNKGPYVTEGLQSILDQRWPNLEILIRDDGSNDNSRDAVQAFIDRNPAADIKLFSGENRGVSFGRNFLMERASSPIVVMQDPDDIMLPNFIPLAVKAMRASGARLVYGDVEVFGLQEILWKPPPFDPFGIRYGNCVAAFCMIDRELWRATGGFDEGLPFNEDWSFFIRAAQEGALVHRLDGAYFRYRQTETGLYHSFVFGNWSHNLHLVMVANSDLYAVEEVLEAARRLREMPPHWPAKFVGPNERTPSSPTPYLVRAIAAIQAANLPTARTLLERCIQKCPKREWLALHLLAELVESREPELAMNLYHHARIRRPDLSRIVNPRIDHLLAHIRGAHATQQ